MADLAPAVDVLPAGGSLLDRKMKKTSAWISGGVVLIALLGGLGYIGVHIAKDMSNVVITSLWAYVLLGVALLIALGFEFVNGFHDTANAVATVIYTHSLDPNIAVVWSGLCNLCGVLMSTGAVAFSIITLLPVELILKVSYGAGFAMVFALLIAAILWNLTTWWFGLPASSSHTMVGSIIGVGVANQIDDRLVGHLGRGLGAGEQGVQGAVDLADSGILLRGDFVAGVQAGIAPARLGGPGGDSRAGCIFPLQMELSVDGGFRHRRNGGTGGVIRASFRTRTRCSAPRKA